MARTRHETVGHDPEKEVVSRARSTGPGCSNNETPTRVKHSEETRWNKEALQLLLTCRKKISVAGEGNTGASLCRLCEEQQEEAK